MSQPRVAAVFEKAVRWFGGERHPSGGKANVFEVSDGVKSRWLGPTRSAWALADDKQ